MKGYNMLSPEDIAENIQISNLEEAVIMDASVSYSYSWVGNGQGMDDARTWD